MTDRLLTVADLAARWDVTKPTIHDWHEAGRLPGAIRLGGTPRGRLRWPEPAVEKIECSWGREDPPDEPPIRLRRVP